MPSSWPALLDAVDDLVSELEIDCLVHGARWGEAVCVQYWHWFNTQVVHHFGKRGVFRTGHGPACRPSPRRARIDPPFAKSPGRARPGKCSMVVGRGDVLRASWLIPAIAIRIVDFPSYGGARNCCRPLAPAFSDAEMVRAASAMVSERRCQWST